MFAFVMESIFVSAGAASSVHEREVLRWSVIITAVKHTGDSSHLLNHLLSFLWPNKQTHYIFLHFFFTGSCMSSWITEASIREAHRFIFPQVRVRPTIVGHLHSEITFVAVHR